MTAKHPTLAVGADIMVGFPGEDQAAFTHTYTLLEELPLAYLHVFPYSPRPGTPAATFPHQIAPAEKNDGRRHSVAWIVEKGNLYAPIPGNTTAGTGRRAAAPPVGMDDGLVP